MIWKMFMKLDVLAVEAMETSFSTLVMLALLYLSDMARICHVLKSTAVFNTVGLLYLRP